jgi:hypothetical protein
MKVVEASIAGRSWVKLPLLDISATKYCGKNLCSLNQRKDVSKSQCTKHLPSCDLWIIFLLSMKGEGIIILDLQDNVNTYGISYCFISSEHDQLCLMPKIKDNRLLSPYGLWASGHVWMMWSRTSCMPLEYKRAGLPVIYFDKMQQQWEKEHKKGTEFWSLQNDVDSSRHTSS